MEIPHWKISVLKFNPTELYERINVNHFKRKQTVGMNVMWPTLEKGVCSCGCGTELTGKQKRWASKECQDFAVSVHQIIGGDPLFVDRFLELYTGNRCCASCGKEDKDCPESKWRDNFSFIQKDHIIPVHKGGGGCWLDNYQFLCDDCHKLKSKNDR